MTKVKFIYRPKNTDIKQHEGVNVFHFPITHQELEKELLKFARQFADIELEYM